MATISLFQGYYRDHCSSHWLNVTLLFISKEQIMALLVWCNFILQSQLFHFNVWMYVTLFWNGQLDLNSLRNLCCPSLLISWLTRKLTAKQDKQDWSPHRAAVTTASRFVCRWWNLASTKEGLFRHYLHLLGVVPPWNQFNVCTALLWLLLQWEGSGLFDQTRRDCYYFYDEIYIF